MDESDLVGRDFLLRVFDIGQRVANVLTPYRGKMVMVGFEIDDCSETDDTALVYVGTLAEDDMDLRQGFTLGGMNSLYCFNMHDPSVTTGAGSWCFRSYECIMEIYVLHGSDFVRAYERLES